MKYLGMTTALAAMLATASVQAQLGDAPQQTPEQRTDRIGQEREGQIGQQREGRFGRPGQQDRALTAEERRQQSVLQPGEVSEQQLNKEVKDINRASSFIGMEVRNLQNERLGTVSDLVFDPTEEKISYVVLGVGGFLGLGEKNVAVPMKSLKPVEGQNHLVANMSRDQLASAPGLRDDQWPRLDAFQGAGTGAPGATEAGAGQQDQQREIRIESDLETDRETRLESELETTP